MFSRWPVLFVFWRMAAVGAFGPVQPRAAGQKRTEQDRRRLARGAEGSSPCEESGMPFYAMGANIALQVNGAELLQVDEIDFLVKGFGDTLKGAVPRGETRAVLERYGPAVNEMLQDRSSRATEAVKAQGAKFVDLFLEANEGATVTDSGLVFLSTASPEKEDGPTPSAEAQVRVHYHGSLPDGTIFDSSVERGEPIEFQLKGVIAGWQEGLQLMREGEKAVLLCPSDLAYGDRGSPPTIPPGATLKFEVNLLSVTEPPPPPEQEKEPEVVRINLEDFKKFQESQQAQQGN